MPKYIIYIKITLFKKHVQNVVALLSNRKSWEMHKTEIPITAWLLGNNP